MKLLSVNQSMASIALVRVCQTPGPGLRRGNGPAAEDTP